MLANDPSSSKLERVYEQSAQENLERTAYLLFSHYQIRFVCSILFLQKQTACYLPCTFIDYTWNIFVINILPMLANDPSSSKLERVYEQSAQENLERTAYLLFSHYHSWTWTQASYRQCTHALC